MQPEGGAPKPVTDHLEADVAGLCGVHGTMLLRLDARDVGSLFVDGVHAEFSAALRFHTRFFPGALPAAGLPWFMAIFGRDSLITSFQALPFYPDLAATTLFTLALFQGRRLDDFRDEGASSCSIFEVLGGRSTPLLGAAS